MPGSEAGDQASLPVQVGLLNAKVLPVIGRSNAPRSVAVALRAHDPKGIVAPLLNSLDQAQ